MKACALGCTPVLPNRAVYPEIYDEVHLFDSPSEAAKIIKSAIDEYPMGTITPLKVVVGGRLVDGILQQE